MAKQKIMLITAGDPNGIGPEVTMKALGKIRKSSCIKIIIGSSCVYEFWAKKCKTKLNLPVAHDFGAALEAASKSSYKAAIYDTTLLKKKDITPGKLSARAGKEIVSCLNIATELLLADKADAIVTGPVDKRLFKMHGEKFSGHTEWLAKRAGVKNVVMMLSGEGLRVIPLTRHIPIAEVPRSINKQDIITTAKITTESLRRYWKIKKPAIGILSLNPHAGENGDCGSEEKRIILPAINALKKSGIRVEGPLSPDAAFTKNNIGRYDVIISMYHDQGLIPLKMLAFDSGVNITLGLPFIRTAPDHGTAYDIAGKNIASPNSMINAIKAAEEMATHAK